jgi:hypothetical protein
MEENRSILRESLLDACQASYVPIIVAARERIFDLPRQWVIDNIHSMAQEVLDLSDGWEYRRLIEVYEELDNGLLKMVLDLGLKSNNDDIKEIASHYRPKKK